MPKASQTIPFEVVSEIIIEKVRNKNFKDQNNFRLFS